MTPLKSVLIPAKHGFFGRRGGVSTGIFESLNCGIASGDDPEKVLENRARVTQTLGIPDAALCVCSQIHSSTVVEVSTPWQPTDSPKADAMVTTKPSIALGVLTADCAPLLFHAPGVIGAAHAGWGGALNGVIQNTIAKMQEMGSKLAEISVAIGPCIAFDSYEIGAERRDEFLKISPDFARFFKPSAFGNADKFQFDLKGFCAHQVSSTGVKNLEVLPHDTLTNEPEFFSFRRTTHRGETEYGRQISVIVL